MKRLLSVLIVALFAAVWVVSPAMADPGDPVGSCSPAFELHHFMDHVGEHMHHHIGLVTDLNGDGWICMKMLPNDLHLHVDNSLPLR